MGYYRDDGRYVYETYYQEQRRLYPDRPWKTHATWELQNIKKALSLLTFLNTQEDEQRLTEVTRELKLRRASQ